MGWSVRVIVLLLAAVLFGFNSAAEAQYVQSGEKISFGSENSSVKQNVSAIRGDTLKLADNTERFSRPVFNTVHLIAGLGWAHSDFNDINELNRENNAAIQFSLQMFIPLSIQRSSTYIVAGYDFGFIGSGITTLKGIAMYQVNRFPAITPLVGAGVGHTWYSDRRTESSGVKINVDAKQRYILTAVGVNLSPQRWDFLLTIPLAPRLSDTVVDPRDDSTHEIRVRPAAIQFSLIFSLR